MQRSSSNLARYITRAGIVAGLYATITLLLAPISFGPIQLRVSEALSVLPIVFPEAIIGLFVGVLTANLFGPYGILDAVIGSLVTLLAAYVSWRFRCSIVAYLSPVVLNAVLVSLYLHILAEVPYWITALAIAASEAVVVFAIGFPLVRYLKSKTHV